MAKTDESLPEDARTARTDADANAASATGPGLLPLILGGFLAGGIGFLAAYYTEFGLFDAGGEDDTLVQAIGAQEARIDEIETALGAPDETGDRLTMSEESLAELRDSMSSIDSRLGGVELGLSEAEDPQDALDPAALDELSAATDTRISGLRDEIAALTERLATIDTRVEDNSGGPTDEQLSALEERMTELVNRIDEQNARIEEQNGIIDRQNAAIADAEAAAEAETARISAQAALSEIRAAVENGEPFQEAVGSLESASDVEVPDALSSVAPEGVATLADLQSSYPEASRAGLGVAVRETAGEGAIDRFGAFLKSQTGARSLGEKPGAAPDAILSRAEARVNEGDIAAALDELEALPEGGRGAMSDWIDRAERRVAAVSAMSDLTQTLNSN